MKTADLPWNALETGLQVMMKGLPWEIVQFSMEEVTVARAGREITRSLPGGNATVVLDARTRALLKERAEAAEGVLRSVLGAERDALGNPEAYVPILPTKWYGEDDLRMHLRFMHGIYEVDIKGVPGLLDAHVSTHADRDVPYYLPHIHHDLED